jgi:hypothetical protein
MYEYEKRWNAMLSTGVRKIGLLQTPYKEINKKKKKKDIPVKTI